MIIKKVAKKIFPRHSRRGRIVVGAASKVGLAKPVNYEFEYERWMKSVEPFMFLPAVEIEKEDAPLFSIVIPFYNTKKKYLPSLFDSIINQTFSDWELIVGDGSTDESVSDLIKRLSNQDSRIKYHKFTKNTDISGNTNQAVEKSTGRYIVFCDHDDVLDLHALNETAAAIQADSTVDIIYSDEDKLNDSGKMRHSPFFKPDWSPHTFLHTNYTNHLSVVRRDLVGKVGGLRKEFNGAQDYDLLLRIHRSADKPLNVKHIDKILYHWREAAGSTAANHSSKSYAFDAGRRALQEYMDSGGFESEVSNIKNRPGFYQHKLTPKKLNKAIVYVGVSDDMKINNVVADKLEALTKKYDNIETEYKPINKEEIDKAPISSDPHTATFKFKTVAYPWERDWLIRLMGALEIPDIKCIAPRVLASDAGTIVDMGIVKDAEGNDIPLFEGLASDDQTINGHTEWVRDVDELSGNIVGYPPEKNTERKYNVVWSYVLFCRKPVFGKTTFFNSNLRLQADEDGNIGIEVNG